MMYRSFHHIEYALHSQGLPIPRLFHLVPALVQIQTVLTTHMLIHPLTFRPLDLWVGFTRLCLPCLPFRACPFSPGAWTALAILRRGFGSRCIKFCEISRSMMEKTGDASEMKECKLRRECQMVTWRGGALRIGERLAWRRR